MKTVYTNKEASNEIVRLIELFNSSGSHYFMLNDIKIRVSDHSANKKNNADSQKTISFILKRCDQGYNMMADEYLINSDGSMNENWNNVEDCLNYIID